MQIGYDQPGESAYHLHFKKKQMYLDQAIELCSKVVEIKDINKFKLNFVRYVIDECKIKMGLMQVKEIEFLKLVDIPISQIRKLQDQYDLYHINLDAPTPSFEIHTTNKEQEIEYKALLGLCKELNLYKQPLPLPLQFQFNGDILFKDNKWIPNYNKIMLL